jgi:hypothetical protein
MRPLQSERLLNASRERRTQPSCLADGESSGAISRAGQPGPGLNHVVRGGRVVRATPSSDPQPTQGLFTEAPT